MEKQRHGGYEDRMMEEIDDESSDEEGMPVNHKGGGGGGGYAAPPAASDATSAIDNFGSDYAAQEGIENFGGDYGANTASTDKTSMRNFLLRPKLPHERTQQCYIMRDRSRSNYLKPIYSLYEEDSHQFLMQTQKQMKNKTSYYLFTMDGEKGAVNRKSPNVVGKLRGNWSGSEFNIYDRGMKPDKAATASALREELGTICFEYDKMGPGKMKVYIPSVSSSGRPFQWKPKDANGKIDHVLKNDLPAKENLTLLVNKRPQWDEATAGHVLNFHGRVTMSSVKNFQLGFESDGDQTVLQFGRVAKHKFTMDFQHPLTPFQAFAICISSLDSKIADSKGYDTLQKMTSSDPNVTRRPSLLSRIGFGGNAAN